MANNSDSIYVGRLKRLFPHAEGDLDSYQNHTNVNGQGGPPPVTTTAFKGSLNLNPVRSGLPKSGLSTMDTDAIVIYSALRRLEGKVSSHPSCPKELQTDVDVEISIIKNTVDSMMRSLKKELNNQLKATKDSIGHHSTHEALSRRKSVVFSGGDGGSTESNDIEPALRVVNPSQSLPPDKLYARRRSVVSSWADPYAMELRSQSRNGIWALLLRHLQIANREYTFYLHHEHLIGKRIPLTREATMYGLSNTCDTVFRYKSMTLRITRRPMTSNGGRGDMVGLIGYLTFLNKQMNIHDSRTVFVQVSSSFGNSNPNSIVEVGTKQLPFVTCNVPKSWVQVDFNDAVVCPSGYSFASYHPIIAGFYPRSWTLSASIDGMVWETLREHVHDTSLTKTTTRGYWSVQTNSGLEDPSAPKTPEELMSIDPFMLPGRRYYRYFRLTQTDKNSFGQDDFQITGLEIFGDILHVVEFQKSSLCSSIPVRPEFNAPPLDLPVQPGQKGGGKK
eukprot:PhF_6_TR5578/c0_g1_i1/m.7984